MNISLIGMSGSGKTHWSKKLEQAGFKRFCVDDLIEEKLGKELTTQGFQGIKGVAKWMGQPFEPQNKKAQTTYLALEEKTVAEICTRIEKENQSRNIIVDTTGSLVYLKQDVIRQLARLTTMIYFKVPRKIEKQMYEIYIQDPKPVIWGNTFTRMEGESNEQSLARCYHNLLKFRAARYQKLAHLTFNYNLIHHPSFTTQIFLAQTNNKNAPFQIW